MADHIATNVKPLLKNVYSDAGKKKKKFSKIESLISK